MENRTEINAITLVTVDMAASVAFYEALGLTIAYGGPDEPFSTMRLDPGEPGSKEIGTNYVNLQHTGETPGTGWGRVILFVPSPDAVYERALDAGYPAMTEPADAPWGERYFHILDPSGHELSFARRLETP